MRLGLRRLGLLCVVALLAGLLLPATGASAATTFEVSIGRFLKGAPAESMRFFPSAIQVHPGDTLHFTSDSFHTATLLPVGQGVDAWVDANAKNLTSDPWAFVTTDPDDGPSALKFGGRAFFPSDMTCGGPDQPPCSFSGTGDPVNGVMNSGVPFFGPLDFSVTITASPGSTLWALCLVHENMRMKIEVVGAGESVPSQKQINQSTSAQVSQDTDAAQALDARYRSKQSKHVTADGTTVWDAWAGVDSAHVTLYAMYPKVLNVKRGQSVQWHFDNLIYEDHTVTFPLKQGLKIANGTQPVCDPDGDTGPGPDDPPDMQEPPFCSDPTQLELDLPDDQVPPAGNGVVSGPKDLENSGALGSNVGVDTPYTLKFGAASPSQGFTYVCTIHPFMRGKVIVG